MFAGPLGGRFKHQGEKTCVCVFVKKQHAGSQRAFALKVVSQKLTNQTRRLAAKDGTDSGRKGIKMSMNKKWFVQRLNHWTNFVTWT